MSEATENVGETAALAPDRLDTLKATIAEVLAERDRLREIHGADDRVMLASDDWPGFSAMLDGFIKQMLDLYPEVGTVEEAQRIFEGENYPIDVAPAGVLAISVMRRLLQAEKLPFMMSKHPAFREFADRYRHIVMA